MCGVQVFKATSIFIFGPEQLKGPSVKKFEGLDFMLLLLIVFWSNHPDCRNIFHVLLPNKLVEASNMGKYREAWLSLTFFSVKYKNVKANYDGL